MLRLATLVAVAYCFLLSTITGRRNKPTIYTRTFKSPAVTLYPGQIANTAGNEFEMEWIKEPIAVTYFDSEVVDEDGNAVALYDLYIHHYLIFVNYGKNSAGPCGLANTWGIGAEMRGTVYEYPWPYAIVFDGTETLSANLHFIRTDMEIGQNIHQLCIECHCWDGTLDAPHGSIGCCDDQGYCWGAPMPNATSQAKNYYLQYTVKYTNVTDEVKPLIISQFDVMSEENFDCSIEYQVSQDSVANNQQDIRTNTSHVLQDTEIVFVEIHQHVGGVKYTVDHYRNDTYIATICEASPVYGNGTTVGNEDGYVVAIPTCSFDADSPYKVLRGDRLVLTSYYDSRHITGGYPFHEGVMGLLFYWGYRTGPSLCESTLKTLCGNPLPASSDDCYDCAQKYAADLDNADCGGHYLWQEIFFLCLTDNGIKRDYPINSSTILIEGENEHNIKKGSKKEKEIKEHMSNVLSNRKVGVRKATLEKFVF